MLKVKDLFNVEHTKAKAYLSAYEYPWQALEKLGAFIEALGNSLDKEEYREIFPKVWVHNGAKVCPTAQITAPCIIDEGTEIRHCAYIRGNALIGKNCVVGNSVELKNCILFDGVQVPHFNYIGDSILGYKAHFGAGAITSNVKSDKTPVIIRYEKERIETGRKKVGAFVGDGVEVGCNSVLNPGTVVGKNTRIYPLSCVRGTVQQDCVYKNSSSCLPLSQAEKSQNESRDK